MKALLCFCILITAAYAQDPTTYMQAFDAKVYSLKNKGVQDFVVDIESSKLTKQLNEQQLFGKLNEVIFRIYWTAKPERLAIEVLGMPEGFKEVKEDLKASILLVMDNLIPQTTAQRFAGYKFASGPGPKQITASDTSGVAAIPSFLLKYDAQDKLIEVVGKKTIGSFTVIPEYEKSSFAGGGWILSEQTTITEEYGQTMTTKKKLDYEKSNGIGVLSEVEITTTHSINGAKAKPTKANETLEFKNYKINEGVALNYFLGESKASSEAPAKP